MSNLPNPVDEDAADAALCYSLWDAENSTRMDPEFLEIYMTRARITRHWLQMHGHDVTRRE